MIIKKLYEIFVNQQLERRIKLGLYNGISADALDMLFQKLSHIRLGVDIPTLNKTEYVKYLLFFLNFSLKLLFLFFALFLCMSAHVRYKNGRLIY